jgi:hypothetical protein
MAERDKALIAALAALNERLGGMNEFRQALTDERALTARRDEVRSLIDGVTARHDSDVQALKEQLAELKVRQDTNTRAYALLAAGAALAGSLLALFLRGAG